MKVEFGMKNEECRMQKLGTEGTLGVLARMTAETEQSREATGGVAASEMGAGWLAPQFLVSLYKELASIPDGPERFALLQKASGNVVSMQLAGVWAGRLRVEQEKLAFLHQKHKDLLELAKSVAAAKVEAVKVATTKKRDLQEPMTEEELKACVDKVDEIFGLKGAKIISTHAATHAVEASFSETKSLTTDGHRSMIDSNEHRF